MVKIARPQTLSAHQLLRTRSVLVFVDPCRKVSYHINLICNTVLISVSGQRQLFSVVVFTDEAPQGFDHDEFYIGGFPDMTKFPGGQLFKLRAWLLDPAQTKNQSGQR